MVEDKKNPGIMRGAKIPGWLAFLLIFAAYLIIQRWVLPACGIRT